MKIWKLVAVASVAAISGLVATSMSSRSASADDSWSCAGHTNLTNAHASLVTARGHIHSAQVNNDWDMKGNAASAETSIKAAIASVEAACAAIPPKH
jgi:hypothetical protein